MRSLLGVISTGFLVWLVSDFTRPTMIQPRLIMVDTRENFPLDFGVTTIGRSPGSTIDIEDREA